MLQDGAGGRVAIVSAAGFPPLLMVNRAWAIALAKGVSTAMFVTRIKLATTILLTPLTCSAICLAGHPSMEARQSAPIQAPLPQDKDAKLSGMDAEHPAEKGDEMGGDSGSGRPNVVGCSGIAASTDDSLSPAEGNSRTVDDSVIIADKMFPDGIEYDFGKVTRGKQYKHTFRIVNTTNAPLKMLSLRSA
jgi:hypothetical protein